MDDGQMQEVRLQCNAFSGLRLELVTENNQLEFELTDDQAKQLIAKRAIHATSGSINFRVLPENGSMRFEFCGPAHVSFLMSSEHFAILARSVGFELDAV